MATASTSTESLVNNEEKDEKIKENSDKKSPKSDSEDKKEDDDSSTRAFECNICLDTGHFLSKDKWFLQQIFYWILNC